MEHGAQQGIEQSEVAIEQKRPDHAYGNRTRDEGHEVEHTVDSLPAHVIETKRNQQSEKEPAGHRNGCVSQRVQESDV